MNFDLTEFVQKLQNLKELQYETPKKLFGYREVVVHINNECIEIRGKFTYDTIDVKQIYDLCSEYKVDEVKINLRSKNLIMKKKHKKREPVIDSINGVKLPTYEGHGCISL